MDDGDAVDDEIAHMRRVEAQWRNRTNTKGKTPTPLPSTILSRDDMRSDDMWKLEQRLVRRYSREQAPTHKPKREDDVEVLIADLWDQRWMPLTKAEKDELVDLTSGWRTLAPVANAVREWGSAERPTMQGLVTLARARLQRS